MASVKNPFQVAMETDCYRQAQANSNASATIWILLVMGAANEVQRPQHTTLSKEQTAQKV